MKTYIKFLINIFLKSFFFVSFVLFSLIFILNILNELEFFKDIPVKTFFPIFLGLLNSPSQLFEMFPFIFLISTQVFFLNLINNNQIQTFKYSGLKNFEIIKIISITTFVMGIVIIILFYNISSNFKNYYLEIKFKYTADGKYLAVVTNNGLWIKDIVDGNINIINSSKIEQNFLEDAFITQFDSNFNIIRNIKSEKIDINNHEWIIKNPIIYKDGISVKEKEIYLNSNFDYQTVKNLFSNLSSLSLLNLYELRKNYNKLNYSTTEVDVQIHKILSLPIYFTLMVILSSIIMFKSKNLKNNIFKLSIGLFISVIIYYLNNFFNVMGNTEKISIITSVWIPLIIVLITNYFFMKKINAY